MMRARPHGVRLRCNANPRCMHLWAVGRGLRCIKSRRLGWGFAPITAAVRLQFMKNHPVAHSRMTRTNPRYIHLFKQ
ncbi:hypothetical protein HarHp1_135 [Haloarcula virus Harhisp1]|nr:hypothetical protein HarHp1_135 [Haloarcula virus Harhisp1]